VRRLSRCAPAIRGAALAASACTAYSADTSWRFAADYLAMGSRAERSAMFAAAELGLLATALMARQNLNGPKSAAGVPGVLVWVITGVQIIPAYAESGLIGGTVRAFVGPVMAALLWHLAMGIELRHRAPGATSRSLAALVAREVRERTLSRLGLAVRDRDATQITRDRATSRAVALAARLAELDPRQRETRRARRTARRLSVAVGRAAVGSDADQRRKLLELLAARRNAAALATVHLPSPWTDTGVPPAPEARALAGRARDDMARATAVIRSWPREPFTEHLGPNAPNAPDRPDQPSATDHSSRERPPLKLGTADALAAIEAGWTGGLSVRETARRATRAPSYVHSVFTRLDAERGLRPANTRDAAPDVQPGAPNAHPAGPDAGSTEPNVRSAEPDLPHPATGENGRSPGARTAEPSAPESRTPQPPRPEGVPHV
jgi:hypothetical protein